MNADPQKVRSIFLAAVENHAPDQWAAFLDQACGTDTDLRRRVEVLLRAHCESDSLLDAPAGDMEATVDDSVTERPGTVIGPYKLLEQIGEGGMGTVWMAQQQEPVKRWRTCNTNVVSAPAEEELARSKMSPAPGPAPPFTSASRPTNDASSRAASSWLLRVTLRT